MFNSDGPDYLQLFMDKRLAAHDKTCIRTIIAGLYGMKDDNKYEGYLKHYLPILEAAGEDTTPFINKAEIVTARTGMAVVTMTANPLSSVEESPEVVTIPTITVTEPPLVVPKKRGRKPKIIA